MQHAPATAQRRRWLPSPLGSRAVHESLPMLRDLSVHFNPYGFAFPRVVTDGRASIPFGARRVAASGERVWIKSVDAARRRGTDEDSVASSEGGLSPVPTVSTSGSHHPASRHGHAISGWATRIRLATKPGSLPWHTVTFPSYEPCEGERWSRFCLGRVSARNLFSDCGAWCLVDAGPLAAPDEAADGACVAAADGCKRKRVALTDQL